MVNSVTNFGSWSVDELEMLADVDQGAARAELRERRRAIQEARDQQQARRTAQAWTSSLDPELLEAIADPSFQFSSDPSKWARADVPWSVIGSKEQAAELAQQELQRRREEAARTDGGPRARQPGGTVTIGGREVPVAVVAIAALLGALVLLDGDGRGDV